MARAEEFLARHGRLPKRHSGDAAEETAAMWLYSMRRLHSRGELSAERIKQLDRTLGNWRTPGRPPGEDAYWFARMTDLEASTASAGRLPQPG
nr:helicase associated domain-containing protein [Arthrobacter sp. H14]